LRARFSKSSERKNKKKKKKKRKKKQKRKKEEKKKKKKKKQSQIWFFLLCKPSRQAFRRPWISNQSRIDRRPAATLHATPSREVRGTLSDFITGVGTAKSQIAMMTFSDKRSHFLPRPGVAQKF